MTVRRMILCMVLIIAIPLWAEAGFSRTEIELIANKLEGADIPSEFVYRTLADERLEKLDIVVSRNVFNQESQRDYESFTNGYSLHVARRFYKKWHSKLTQASQRFQVDPHVIVAILLVETAFGQFPGQFPVISVYASMVLAYEELRLEQQEIGIPPALSEQDAYFEKRLKTKATWALEELRSILLMGSLKNIDILNLRGSYAGAFGVPQFIPSSYLSWGYDGNHDGHVDLFQIPDAIYSVANYLSEHGWKGTELTRAENYEAVLGYNYSRIYADTVIQVAGKLKKKTL
ncbi:MAG: lytic murein transglycosylase [SAR324 cluster bacterium]|nr:lytic murein transglycosylase [SAR324 cluster bacterium]